MSDYKQVIVINKELGMRSGKMIAQGAHVSVKAAIDCKNYYPIVYTDWNIQGHKKVALYLPSTAEMVKLKDSLKNSLIPWSYVIDQGLTQVPPNSLTAIAIGPWHEHKIDEITGSFKLVN